jgi:hypothetical protein
VFPKSRTIAIKTGLLFSDIAVLLYFPDAVLFTGTWIWLAKAGISSKIKQDIVAEDNISKKMLLYLDTYLLLFFVIQSSIIASSY